MSQYETLVKRALGPLSAYKAFAKSFPAKLDANESPWPLPENARARIAELVSSLDLHRYPDAGAHALRRALASRFGVSDPDMLVLGVGSDEAISMLMRALSEPRTGRTKAAVLFPEPSFVMYGMRAVIEDCEPVAVPLTPDWQLDLARIEREIAQKAPNLIFLATPNNPTGNAFHEADIERVIELAPSAIVVIDEAYAAFAGKTLRPLRERYENVAIMGTLSKIGFAALRVGWVELPKKLANEVEKTRQPYNLNGLSQAIATLAVTELWPTVEGHIAAIRAERTNLAAQLSAFPSLTVFPSDANFFLVRVRGDSQALASALLDRGVSVRMFQGSAGPLAGHVRITVGTPAENELLVQALSDVL